MLKNSAYLITNMRYRIFQSREYVNLIENLASATIFENYFLSPFEPSECVNPETVLTKSSALLCENAWSLVL